jgi:hypothetical protein
MLKIATPFLPCGENISITASLSMAAHNTDHPDH